MKYKALITGSNDDIIDDFFTHMHHIDSLTTSNRYGDVAKHVKYFSPDMFVYCIYQETKEDYSKIIPIKHLLSKQKLPFVVVGSEEECANFERIAANIADLTIQKPLEAEAIQEKISVFMDEWMEKEKIEEPESQTAPAAETAPVGQVPPVMAADQVPPGMMAGTVPAGQVPPVMPAGQMPPGMMAGTVPVGQMPPVMMAGPVPAGQMPPVMAAQGRPAEKAPAPAAKKEKQAAPAKKEEKKPQAGKPAPRRRRKRRTIGKGRILVVDDNPLMLKVIKEHLHEEYDLATATSGRVALRFLERRMVDLILLDYEMPEEDGPSVLKKLRANEKTADVPVVFLTGISDRKKIQKALLLQPDGYLLKPIDHEKLINTIRQYID